MKKNNFFNLYQQQLQTNTDEHFYHDSLYVRGELSSLDGYDNAFKGNYGYYELPDEQDRILWYAQHEPWPNHIWKFLRFYTVQSVCGVNVPVLH